MFTFTKTKYDLFFCDIEKLDIEVVIDSFLFVKIYKKNKISAVKEFGPFTNVGEAMTFCNEIKLSDLI